MPSGADDLLDAIAGAADWDARIALIRQVPERFGLASHAAIYAAIAERVYVPSLEPDIGHVHWRPGYELSAVEESFRLAQEATEGFTHTDRETLARSILEKPASLLTYRLLLGFTAREFAIATTKVAVADGLVAVGAAVISRIECGGASSPAVAAACAATVDRAMQRQLFAEVDAPGVRQKIEKPDTAKGWESVRRYATEGVSLAMLLHQRHYGGAFRQLLDSTSSKRGDVVEDAVKALFRDHQVDYVHTGSQNQGEIARRFNITVRPAPDFVVFDAKERVRALLECKGANDGGTARDKASRFKKLNGESTRHNVPLFAVLSGLGWERTNDALGPVVEYTDGRVFTPATLNEMLSVDPFPSLVREPLSMVAEGEESGST